jgi:hypothetical protein
MAAPIRGTQSFVAIMGQVWRRPSLTALEIAWRWLFGLIFLTLVAVLNGAFVPQRWQEYRDDLTIALHGGLILSVHWGHLVSAVFILTVLWSLTFTLGRTIVLRRLDSSLRASYRMIASLTLLRVLAFESILTLWCWVAAKTTGPIIAAPFDAANGMDMLPAFALLLCATLFLFVLWASVSWLFRLAPLLAMSHPMTFAQSLRAAWQSGPLRGKLIEINLVMGIVKIALIVLAMVFSATPLPFNTITTQTFLDFWWCGVGLAYLALSDYFHVVRAAAYLSLHRAFSLNSQSQNS